MIYIRIEAKDYEVGMSKSIDNLSEKELLAKKKRHEKKVKSKSFTSEINNALNKKNFDKRQGY